MIKYTITLGSQATCCAFCRRRLVILWSDGSRYHVWACLWHTRRAFRALKGKKA